MRLTSALDLARIPIRWRLALLIMALVAAVIVVSSLLVDRVWNGELRRQFDSSLSEEVKEFVTAAATLQSEDELADFADEYLRLHQYEDPSRTFLFRLADGETMTLHVPADGSPIEADLPQPQAGTVSLRTLPLLNGEEYRVAFAPVTVNGEGAGTIYVAQPAGPVDAIIDEHVRNTALAALGGLVIAGVGAYLIARLALAPVRRITRTAQSISDKDLSRRIGFNGARDEVGDLAAAFDRMIGRLDEAFKEQRRLVTDLSHELRTPITVARGHLDLLQSIPDRSGLDAEESLDAAIQELDRMNRLVADLFTLARSSRPDFLRREAIHLRALLQESMTKAHSLGDRRWVLGEVPDCAIVGDKDYLAGALLNLLQNALQHTQPGDSIGVDAALQDGRVAIRVWDTGEGIPPEHLRNIFERFYRAASPRAEALPGAGLGLAIVKAVASAHGGTVEVDSDVGKGSVFTIRLPAEQDRVPAGAGKVEGGSAAGERSLRKAGAKPGNTAS